MTSSQARRGWKRDFLVRTREFDSDGWVTRTIYHLPCGHEVAVLVGKVSPEQISCPWPDAHKEQE